MTKEDVPVLMKRCACELEVCIRPSFTCLQYSPSPLRSAAAPSWARAPSSRLHDHTTLGRPPLGTLSAGRRDLYITHRKERERESELSPPLRDSNLQFQQASSRKPTPYTARPTGSVCLQYYFRKCLTYPRP